MQSYIPMVKIICESFRPIFSLTAITKFHTHQNKLLISSDDGTHPDACEDYKVVKSSYHDHLHKAKWSTQRSRVVDIESHPLRMVSSDNS